MDFYLTRFWKTKSGKTVLGKYRRVERGIENWKKTVLGEFRVKSIRVGRGSPVLTFTYSFRQWIWTVCHFMKQKCYFQRGVAECRHAATPLSSYSINTTLQGFQKRYITLLYLKGFKSYQEKCKWKVRFTKESGVKCRHIQTLIAGNVWAPWKPWSVVLMLKELKGVAACLHSATPHWK